MMKKLTTLFLFLLLGLPFTHLVQAQSLPADERQKIDALIKQVSTLSDATFIRNGSSYSSTVAVAFLHAKWDANAAKVKSARDFIDNIASMSGAGKPYLIRLKDGREITGRDFLLGELQKLNI